MRSCRTRSWWSRGVAGVALGRAWSATAGPGPAGQGPVGALLVGDGHELVQQLLGAGPGWWLVGLGGEPLLLGVCWNRSTLPGGGGLGRAAVVLLDVAAAQLGLQGVAAGRGRRQRAW